MGHINYAYYRNNAIVHYPISDYLLVDFAYCTIYVGLNSSLAIFLIYKLFIPLMFTSLRFILFQALISPKPGKILSHCSLELIHFSHQLPASVYPTLTSELFLKSFPISILTSYFTLWSPPYSCTLNLFYRCHPFFMEFTQL